MKYFIYCRKSTEAEDRQVLSLDSQEKELLTLAKNLNINISKTYRESMSAKAPGRPIFEKMLKDIEKIGESCLITWKLDRLARNAFDGGKLSWLMDRKLISEIITPEKTFHNTGDDKFMMSLDFGMAKKYVDDLSTNVKRGNRAKLEKGGWPGVAPFGYKNDKAEKTIVLDPVRANHIKNLFELFATGGYSLKDLTEKLYQDGLRTNTGKKLCKSMVYHIIKNPFYTGLMLRLGKLYQGSHQPLISQETFDNCQKVLTGVRSKSQKHFFPFRGYMTCETCGCGLTATKKKGYTYYYCTNGKKNCTEHKSYLRAEDIEKIIAKIFSRIKLDKEMIEIMYQANQEKEQGEQSIQEIAIQNIDRELELLQIRRNKLLDSYLAELIPEDVYKSKILALNESEISLKNKYKQIQTKNNMEGYSTLEQTKNTFLQAYYAENNFLEADNDAKRAMLEILLWNLTIKNRKLANFKLKMPYQALVDFSKNTNILEWQGR